MTPFEQFAADYKGRKVLIFGLGTLGRGVQDAAIFAQIGAHVRVTDKKTAVDLTDSIEKLEPYSIEYSLGDHHQADIDWAEVIIRNASVPWQHPLLELSRSQGKPIKMDACLFFEYARPEKSIGVTGTRGKSTTTQLIYQLLIDADIVTQLAGNITPTASLELLKSYDQKTTYVFELSSWQLQAFHHAHISPRIAVLTNIYPDHLLDRSYEEYIQDKTAIYKYQQAGDHLVINQTNQVTQSLMADAPGQIHPFEASQVLEWSTQLKGEHNFENVAAAVQVAQILKLDVAGVKDTVSQFNGLAFRQEIIGTIEGKPVINDTTSTTPVATSKALAAYPESTLILGGTSKKLPTDELIQSVNNLSQKVVLLTGSGTDEIKSKLDSKRVVGEYTNIESAIKAAVSVLPQSQALLFSPGFTSFGMFDNEFDRGRQFNQQIQPWLD